MSKQKAISLISVLVFCVVAVLVACWIFTPFQSAIGSASDPILVIHGASVTSYKAGATSVQDLQPAFGDRGVGIDGGLRKGPALPLHIAGNPFENAGVADGVNTATGGFTVDDIDIALPANGFSFVIGRTYSSLQKSGSSQRTSDGYQGFNWEQSSQPEIALYDADSSPATREANDLVYVVYGADRFVEYKRVAADKDYFKGVNGAAGVIEYIAGTPDIYTLTDQMGFRIDFFGFDTSETAAKGQLWRISDPAANKAYIGDGSSASSAVTSGYYLGGNVRYAYDPSDRLYTYSYSSSAIGTKKRLTQVKVETKTGGTWPTSGTGVKEIARITYDYYSSDGDSFGMAGDLKLVSIRTALTDSGTDLSSGIYLERKKYYRYYDASWSDSNGLRGNAHQIRLVLDFEGVRNVDWTDAGGLDGSYMSVTAGNEFDQLAPYSTAYVEYVSSSDFRVKKIWLNGDCGCGANESYEEYAYANASGYSSNIADTTYQNAWGTRTTVTRPAVLETRGGSAVTSYFILYFDEAAQPLSSVLTNGTPGGGGVTHWATQVIRNSAGQVTEVDTPASVTYTYSSDSYSVGSTTGLIHILTKLGSGSAMEGFTSETRWKKGSSGSSYLVEATTYASFNVGIPSGTPEAHVVRPYIDTRREYYGLETSGTANSNLWTFAHTQYSGKLVTEGLTVTEPVVTTGTNGYGSAYSTMSYFRADGTLAFTKDQSGYINYFKYANGLNTISIVDADTADVDANYEVDIPSGFASTGTEFNQKTINSFDSMGRLDTRTLAYGRVLKSYYSCLADQRVVTLNYNAYVAGTSTFYGPVDYRVSNHAGRAEFSSIVELANNSSTLGLASHIHEGESDPLVAIDEALGTVSRMRVNVYSAAGTKILEQRSYFNTPSSGTGVENDDYDARLFAYDDLGRRVWSRDPQSAGHAGTIREIIYSIHGDVKEEWIGADDGGPDNMTMTSIHYFDNEDSSSTPGNRYLTKSIQRVEDGPTDERATTFINDVRGRVIVQTAPAAPHTVTAYDNLGRATGSALYSSTSGLTESAVPTTTTNRLAYSEQKFDSLGRVWESVRHNINSSGSSTDTLLADNWYDARGNLAKTDGESLAKYSYDRVGRRTHRYVLASDNDGSTYTNMLAVTGDAILQESQTMFDPTHSFPLASASIERNHDDTSTTGALDSNADNDILKYTSTDIKGRIQIVSFWYDSILFRKTDAVAYGTNGGSTWNRSGLSVPAFSDANTLRTSYTYNTAGQVSEIKDPKEIVQTFEFDDQGRGTKRIDNFVSGGAPTDPASNRTTLTTYEDGLTKTVVLDVQGSSDDQTTIYSYAITKGTSLGQSAIAAGHLLSEIQYPDSSGGDTVSFAYNAQGQTIYREDEGGNIFELTHDARGRLVEEYVNTVGSGFDNAIRKRTVSFTTGGDLYEVCELDSTPATRCAVRYTYDGWGNVNLFEQDQNSTVAASGGDEYDLVLAYSKATTGRNTLRRSTMTYESGYGLSFAYTGTYNDPESRVYSISTTGGSPTTLATYEYKGVASVVNRNFSVPNIYSKLYGSGSGNYANLDRFGRKTGCQWTKGNATPLNFYDVSYTFDKDSNQTVRDELTQLVVGFDVSSTFDNLNRKIRAEEGTWGGSSISSRTRDEQWTLKLAGVPSNVKLDLNGDGDQADANEWNDNRTFNEGNELLTRDTNANPPDEYTLAWDAAGNMTSDGKSFTYKYDAWHRLVEVKQIATPFNVIANYRYNGLDQRIAEQKDVTGDGVINSSDMWYHLYYDEAGRHIATYRTASSSWNAARDSNPKEEYVLDQSGLGGHARNTRMIVCRNKDANTAWTSASDGTLEQKTYYCQNGASTHLLVGTIAPNNATYYVLERIHYSMTGEPNAQPGYDTEPDGDCDGADIANIVAWQGLNNKLPADGNLSGTVDGDDLTQATNIFNGTTLGWGKLGATAVGNIKGQGGLDFASVVGMEYQVSSGAVYAADTGVLLCDGDDCAGGGSEPATGGCGGDDNCDGCGGEASTGEPAGQNKSMTAVLDPNPPRHFFPEYMTTDTPIT